MNDKKKLITVLAIVIMIIITVSGATYAVYTYATKEIITGTAECFKINYVKGQNIGSENESRIFMPSADYTGGLFASVIVSTDPSCTITNGVGTLYLTTSESTSEALLSSGALKYQIVENSYTVSEPHVITSTGTIAVENISISSDPKQISVSVWIDGTMLNSDNTDAILSSTYVGNITMKVESGDL